MQANGTVSGESRLPGDRLRKNPIKRSAPTLPVSSQPLEQQMQSIADGDARGSAQLADTFNKFRFVDREDLRYVHYAAAQPFGGLVDQVALSRLGANVDGNRFS